jgi:high-affinity K+ transport system ATPase subunit B
MTPRHEQQPLLTWPIATTAAWQAVRKLDPRVQFRNPVMFVTMIGAAVTSVLFVQTVLGRGEAPPGFILVFRCGCGLR